MPRSHSKKTVIQVDSTDISQHVNTSEFTPSTDSHDVTGYGVDGHEYEGGLTDGTFTMGGWYDTDQTTGPRAVLQTLKGTNAKVTVTRQIEGTGSGLPQDTFSGVLTSYAESAPVADYVQWTAEIQISGDVDSTPQE